ncbi:MAG: hypothetical protein R2932_59835 [Caldilineaceae bacterium]
MRAAFVARRGGQVAEMGRRLLPQTLYFWRGARYYNAIGHAVRGQWSPGARPLVTWCAVNGHLVRGQWSPGARPVGAWCAVNGHGYAACGDVVRGQWLHGARSLVTCARSLVAWCAVRGIGAPRR